MFTFMEGRRSTLMRVVLLLALVAALGVVAMPAGATPPQALHFATTTTYDIIQGPPSISGTWTASGLFESSGDAWIDHFNAGWNDAGLWLRNSHTTEVYTDSQGSIMVEAHITNVTGFNPISGDGRWVIKSGTGAYANLHGEGSVSIYGEITGFPYLTVEAVYSGVGHFD